jgi:RNA polymerase sigma factor (sigma-70 family)
VESPDSESSHWFAREVQPHEAALRAFLHRSFPAADVDDLVQESLFRIWRAKDRSPVREGKGFLFAVARNAARDLLRRRGTAAAIPVTETARMPVLEEEPGVADVVSRRQELDLLGEAIRSLPERCREVFLMRKVQGLSQKEIAARLGISENTVETLVAKGVRRCGEQLRARGLGGDRHGR